MPGLYRVPNSRFFRVAFQAFREPNGRRKQVRLSYRPGNSPARQRWMDDCAILYERKPEALPWMRDAIREQREQQLESVEESEACALAWATHLEECRRELEGEESAVRLLYSKHPLTDRLTLAWSRAVNDLEAVGVLSEAAAHEYLEKGPGRLEEITVRSDGGDLLGPAVESFIAGANHLSVRTRANYTSYLKFVREKCGDSMPIARVYEPDMLLWLAKEHSEKAKGHVRHEKGAVGRRLLKQSLSTLANHLIGRGILEENRVGKIIPSIKEEKKERRLFTEKQIEALLKSAAAWSQTARERGLCLTDWQIILRLLLATGVRQQSLARLQWKHLRLSPAGKAEVIVQPGKSKREVRIPLRRELVRDVRLWRLKLPAAFRAPGVHVLSLGTKRPRPCADPGKQLEKIFEGAAIPYTGLHVFRHTAAIKWLDAGLDIEDVSHLLGHSDLQTTMVYLRWWKSLKNRDSLRGKMPKY